MEQQKESERDFEGVESQIEGSDGSDVVISNQLKSQGEERGKISNSRHVQKLLLEFLENSRFNPRYFENRMNIKQAKYLVRYNELEYKKAFGV